MKRVLVQLAQLETVEAKTSKPENYSRIGVADVGPDSDSTAVDVYGALIVASAGVAITTRDRS
mgnify:CR=1 FL=1